MERGKWKEDRLCGEIGAGKTLSQNWKNKGKSLESPVFTLEARNGTFRTFILCVASVFTFRGAESPLRGGWESSRRGLGVRSERTGSPLGEDWESSRRRVGPPLAPPRRRGIS